jgi:hypothetical protein
MRYPLKKNLQANSRVKCGTESCKFCGSNQANPRNINDECARQANFESGAYPVDQPKRTLTTFLLRSVLKARAPFCPGICPHLTSWM